MIKSRPSTDTSVGWVIDASVTIPWFFSDEATPFTEGLLDSLGAQELWAPPLWVLECTERPARRTATASHRGQQASADRR
jgi:hypothetical protein